MKDDINIFEDAFMNEIVDYFGEEANLRELHSQYAKAQSNMIKNNRNRIKVIQEARNNKINEINQELKALKDKKESNKELEGYKEYLLSLKGKICKLFGHDAERMRNSSGDLFECKCCGRKRIGYKEYIETYHNARYKNIVPYYYGDNKKVPTYLIQKPNEAAGESLYLPTYDEYQKKLILNRDKN